ncbi:hypothetical protein CDN99_22285 [Roseateles aquatilis]|uniref:YCII-related domain-containing protein n=1 Tax=Roseateles aquatilis TaxID=431061 RepID=A0A2D0AM20_9BURK|nr:YciI family protein [Roseateles aquatilis]OWQ85272.1 hypothetical protein CDN99_22285 [Roseateles aquatilis]
MRYMIIIKATPGSEAGDAPTEALIDEMATFHEELARAGVLLEGMGLHPSREGWRVQHAADGTRRIVDGPFAETKELIAGFTVIQVRSREEALEWSRRFPAPHGRRVAAEIEIRRVKEIEEVGAAESMNRFRAIGLGD